MCGHQCQYPLISSQAMPNSLQSVPMNLAARMYRNSLSSSLLRNNPQAHILNMLCVNTIMGAPCISGMCFIG